MKVALASTLKTGVPVLQVRALSLRMGARRLIEQLDFEVQAGERWCVIGRNAAGKSSLLRALAGLGPTPQGGAVLLQGDPRALVDGPRAAQLRAYLPQAASDRFDLTVRELLALHRRDAVPSRHATALKRQPGGPGAARATVRGHGGDALQALAASLDIAALLDRPVTQLSGGERQRVGLGAVAAQDTALWLLDEPVSFQDPAHQRSVALWLRAQDRRAVVLSAHDMAWVQQCATHVIALLGDGTWRAGPAAEVLSAQTLYETFGCPWRQVEGQWFTGQ